MQKKMRFSIKNLADSWKFSLKFDVFFSRNSSNNCKNFKMPQARFAPLYIFWKYRSQCIRKSKNYKIWLVAIRKIDFYTFFAVIFMIFGIFCRHYGFYGCHYGFFFDLFVWNIKIQPLSFQLSIFDKFLCYRKVHKISLPTSPQWASGDHFDPN